MARKSDPGLTAPNRKLTPKEAAFVDQYLVDLNATKAAIRAGYSEKSSRRTATWLVSKPHIQEAMAKAREGLAARTRRTVDDVMADIEKVRVSCMQEVPVDGSDCLALLAPKEALRALELEGKHRGAFEADNKQRNPLGTFNSSQFFADIFRRPQG